MRKRLLEQVGQVRKEFIKVRQQGMTAALQVAESKEEQKEEREAH